MKPKPFFTGQHPQTGLLTFILTAVIVVTATPGNAETLVACSGGTASDYSYRGFYVPHYPGNSLDSAQLQFSGGVAGSYGITLTVRSGTYDGTLLGSASRTVTLNGSTSEHQPVTFVFPSITITKNSTVCFILTLTSSPGGGALYYTVGGGCTEVIETDGTTPPLDTFRRNGVNVVITGQNTLRVTPGESIQAAINAASPGETVQVEPGIFTENLTLRSGVSVAGAGYGQTILRGTGTGDVIIANNVTNCQFEGFKIIHTGTGMNDSGIQISGGDMVLNNNWILGHADGVQIYSGSSAIVRNNVVEGNGDPDDAVLDYGIIVLHATPLIANNLVVSNNGAGVYLGWADTSGAQFINNTVIGNPGQGVWCYSTNVVVIKNNILAWNGTGISASHGAKPDISFNDVFGNAWQDYDAQSGGVAAPGIGDISADPLFDTAAGDPFFPGEGSPVIDAGDPAPIYNDRDGSRNDMGAYGGATGLEPSMPGAVTSGFLFNNIGKIPTSEITRTGDQAGLANVSSSVASALHIYQYKDAPFGGNLWLSGLFGSSDTLVSYYKIYAAKWTGATPPGPADFEPITDPLSKIKYTISPSGMVVATLVNVGPDSNGLYLRTDSGYWSHPDLKLIWNTRRVENGRYDLICKGYFLFLGVPVEVSLPSNSLSRITVYVDNSPVTATIDSVRDPHGNVVTECGSIQLDTATDSLQFEITASHPEGFLRSYTLEALYGRNHNAGVIASDQYAGAHDSTPPSWPGVAGLLVDSAPAQTSGALMPWTSCAYQFRLTAWARTTDGFHHIYWRTFNDHYSVLVGALIPSGCVADLDRDGDVDGADLVIFASQFGRTNCLSAPSP